MKLEDDEINLPPLPECLKDTACPIENPARNEDHSPCESSQTEKKAKTYLATTC